MKAIMIMYDSLNRHMLAPYGCEWTKTPNFERLAVCLVCRRGGRFIRGVIISCIGAGGLWNLMMILCRRF